MAFGLDRDATIILFLSLGVIFTNAVFVFSTFVYFCCCVDCAHFGLKPADSNTDEAELEPENTPLNANQEEDDSVNLKPKN